LKIPNIRDMESADFKLELKKVKNSLKGKTVRVVLNGVSDRYQTLRSLGNRILELEVKGYSFSFYNNDYTTIIVNSGIDMNATINSFGINA
jgi:hypothetical protein